MRRGPRRQRLLLGVVVLLGALVGCSSGLEILLVPKSLRIIPGLSTAAPGEIVDYSIRFYSLVGTRIPLVDQAGAWSLRTSPTLPPGVIAPEGNLELEAAGVVDGRGRLEASPVVRPGNYRVGLIRAEVWGTFGTLASTAYIVVDGNVDEKAPTAAVYPQDLRLPPGATVPFMVLSIEPESGRVAPPGDATWTLLSGGGILDAATGLYTAPQEKQPEVRISAQLATGRKALSYLTVDDRAAGKLAKVYLVPDRVLKIGLGRRQRFLAYGEDRDGRYIPATEAQWLVEGDIGTLTVAPDGGAEFLARAAGRGAISVQLGGKSARQEIVTVIPGA